MRYVIQASRRGSPICSYLSRFTDMPVYDARSAMSLDLATATAERERLSAEYGNMQWSILECRDSGRLENAILNARVLPIY